MRVGEKAVFKIPLSLSKIVLSDGRSDIISRDGWSADASTHFYMQIQVLRILHKVAEPTEEGFVPLMRFYEEAKARVAEMMEQREWADAIK